MKISNITGTTVRPLQNGVQQSYTKIDYINLYETLIEVDPNFNTNTNNIYLKRAIDQYNSMVRGTTIRPPVPKSLCGYLDPTTGLLTLNEQAVTSKRNILPYTFLDSLSSEFPTPIPYPLDKCLVHGPPGSYGYVKGCDNDDSRAKYESGIDWPPTDDCMGMPGPAGMKVYTLCNGGAGGSAGGAGDGSIDGPDSYSALAQALGYNGWVSDSAGYGANNPVGYGKVFLPDNNNFNVHGMSIPQATQAFIDGGGQTGPNYQPSTGS